MSEDSRSQAEEGRERGFLRYCPLEPGEPVSWEECARCPLRPEPPLTQCSTLRGKLRPRPRGFWDQEIP
jgi:hypothetical protein